MLQIYRDGHFKNVEFADKFQSVPNATTPEYLVPLALLPIEDEEKEPESPMVQSGFMDDEPWEDTEKEPTRQEQAPPRSSLVANLFHPNEVKKQSRSQVTWKRSHMRTLKQRRPMKPQNSS